MSCKSIILAVAVSLQLNAKAQNVSGFVFSSDGEMVVVPESTGKRQIVGGTVIKVKYKGINFSKQAQGAFEYACKIWEEKIPTTLPINITVKFDKLKDVNCLAKVDAVYDDEGLEEKIFIKRKSVFEKSYYTPQYSLDFIRDFPDVNITFAAPSNFDFSLDSQHIASDKYAFVTVALQAIGKALGLCLTASSDGESIEKNSLCNNFTHALLSEDSKSNYVLATSGNARVTGHGGEGFLLYCPHEYDNKNSLNFFAIDRSNKETLLMQPGVLTKGTVIRYLGDEPWESFFTFCGWDRPIATGISGGNGVVEPASTDDVISYNGTNSSRIAQYAASSNTEEETVESYVNKLREFQNDGTFVLLNDGSWIKCKDDLSDLNDDGGGDYARTVDGYLRVKQCYTKALGGGWPNRSYATYKLADFTPQRPIASVISCKRSNTVSAQTTLADNVCYDVVVGFKNTEGCDEIEVEQTDGVDGVPYYYYVDPKAGVFTTCMEYGVKSKFKLSYINKNGAVAGAPFSYNIPQIPESADKWNRPDIPEVKFDNDMIRYDFSNSYNRYNGSYRISSLSNGNIVDYGPVDENKGEMNIVSLPKGNYSLTFTETNGDTTSLKLVKH